jgi:hypothetical protein
MALSSATKDAERMTTAIERRPNERKSRCCGVVVKECALLSEAQRECTWRLRALVGAANLAWLHILGEDGRYVPSSSSLPALK